MIASNHLTILAALAAGALGASVPATMKRQTPASCTTAFTGFLALRPANNVTESAPTNYAGIVEGVKHAGIDGQSDSLLVTKTDSGKPLEPQTWEFARCTNLDHHALPPGYKVPTSGPSNRYFGILRPRAATVHCLALESRNDAANGARNSVVDSACSKVPEQYRTFMLEDYIYGDSANGNKLYFADEQMTVVIGDTKHQEVQFFTNDANPPTNGQPIQQLVLIPH
ncbi:unnamed protein product [Parajaminaea phylloscopi]